MTKHIHSEVIKAWADGAEIQFHSIIKGWVDIDNNIPNWSPFIKYRVKPEPRTAYQIFVDTIMPEFAPHTDNTNTLYAKGINAVIEALKAGEIKV